MELKINEHMYGISKYMDYILYLFRCTSVQEYPREIDVPNEGWFDYIDLLYKASGQEKPEKNIIENLPEIHIENPTKDIMLGFSGGSDSSTCAAYLKDRPDVSNVLLYYMSRINRSYASEVNAARAVANHLGIELVEGGIKYTGKIERLESPVKNHVILAFMIPEMIKRGVVKCSQGVFPDDTLDHFGGLCGISDVYELFKGFEKAIRYTFPQYRFIICFKNSAHKFAYAIKYHKDMIPLYQSCLLPDRYRNNIRKLNHNKYGIDLMPNRCLSCWKCCREYIMLGMFGYHKIDPAVYKNQCMTVLRKYCTPGFNLEPKEVSKLSDKTILKKYISLEDVQRYVNDMSLVDKDFDEVNQYNSDDCWE